MGIIDLNVDFNIPGDSTGGGTLSLAFKSDLRFQLRGASPVPTSRPSMTARLVLAALLSSSSLLAAACGDDDGTPDDLATEAAPVLEQHATIATAMYADALAGAEDLEEA